MHTREESGERPKALSVQARGKGSRQNQTNWDLLWNGQWKRENVLDMPRCSGGQTTNGVVGSLEKVFTTDKNGW